jgi:hypothetical protein
MAAFPKEVQLPTRNGSYSKRQASRKPVSVE